MIEIRPDSRATGMCQHGNFPNRCQQCGQEKSVETERGRRQPSEYIDDVVSEVFPEGGQIVDACREYLLHGAFGDERVIAKEEFERRSAGKGLEIVDIYQGKIVTVGKGEQVRHMLTHKLNGCVASVLIADRIDGNRDVAMTHFPPFMKARNGAKLTEIVSPEMRQASKKRAMVFMEGKRMQEEAIFIAQIREVLGDDVEIETYPYVTDTTKPDTGVIVVDIPSQGTGNVRVHTWDETITTK